MLQIGTFDDASCTISLCTPKMPCRREGGENKPALLREGRTGHDLSAVGCCVGYSHPPTKGGDLWELPAFKD